jgi:hypothetical protein
MPSSQLPIDAEWLPMHADRSQYDKILSRDRDSGTCEVGFSSSCSYCVTVSLCSQLLPTTMFAVSDEECFLTILIAGLISMLTARVRVLQYCSYLLCAVCLLTVSLSLLLQSESSTIKDDTSWAWTVGSQFYPSPCHDCLLALVLHLYGQCSSRSRSFGAPSPSSRTPPQV